MSFRKAERKKAKLRLSLCGPSGSGKTLGALKIAKGMGYAGKIAFIDTENGSGDLYSDVVDFDTNVMSSPFSPRKYIGLIKDAEARGYEVLIIDSLSHAWAGEGGILDIHDKETRASSAKNSYMAWGKVTPQQNELINTIIQSKMHIIVCLRTKTAHEIVEENGKKKPVKIGLAPIQRDGVEYEFTAILDLSVEGHYYTSSKDRTGIFDGNAGVITEKTGEQLMEWLNSGKDTPQSDGYSKYVDNINLAQTMDELKESFQAALPLFKKDKVAIDAITKAKDARKEILLNLELAQHKGFIDDMTKTERNESERENNNLN